MNTNSTVSKKEKSAKKERFSKPSVGDNQPMNKQLMFIVSFPTKYLVYPSHLPHPKNMANKVSYGK